MKKYSILFLSFILIGNISTYAGFSDVLNFCRSKCPSGDSVKKYGAPVALLCTAAVAGTCLLGAENFSKLCINTLAAPFFGLYKLSVFAGPKKTIGGVAAGLAGTGIYHRWYLYNVDSTLNNALNTQDPKDSKFLFSVWGINQWQKASEIKANKEAVKGQLKSLDLGAAKDKKAETLVVKISAEKEQYKKWIRYIGGFTDVPAKFVEAMKTKKKDTTLSDLSDADNALELSGFLKDYDIDFDSVASNCKATPENSIVYATQWSLSNPLQIVLFPFYDTATTLCKRLIAYYGRLCVLEDLAKEIRGEKSPREQAAASLLNKASSSARLTGSVDSLLPKD